VWKPKPKAVKPDPDPVWGGVLKGCSSTGVSLNGFFVLETGLKRVSAVVSSLELHNHCFM
jgi:hypothetical protein